MKAGARVVRVGGFGARASEPVVTRARGGGPSRRWVAVRIGMCAAALALMTIWVGKRAVDLQVRQAGKLADFAESNSLREVEVAPRRGRVLDRKGMELASTLEVDSVFCNPRVLAGVPDAASKLARALAMDVREVRSKLATRKYFVWLKRQVGAEISSAVKALALPGVGTTREPKRFYPLRALGSTVVGLAGTDGRGLEGIELAFESTLRGEPATVRGIKDALGRELLLDGVVDTSGVAGRDVVLTIDSYLQLTTESVLQKTAAQFHAVAATSLMMDPRTGEVLAMASVPMADPSDPAKALSQGARNRAITDSYEPGSIQKTITFAAALDAKVVRPSDLFDCQMGRMQVGKYTVHDSHPLGTLTAAEVFQHSSNIGTVKIARRLGRERLAEALRKFGLGQRTGIELPGERAGIVRPLARWGDIGFANIAFGQGLTVTPLQMVSAYAAVASGGVYRAPHVVREIVFPDGHAETRAGGEGVGRRVMSEAAARTLLTIMQGVTEEKGTAKAAAIPGYLVAGKTGTAQKVVGGHYARDKYIASFIGVVPANNPRLVIAVIVDEPKPLHMGGQVAAPAFKEIAEAALKYLSVPATEPLTDPVPGAPVAGVPAPATSVAKGTPGDVAGGNAAEGLGSDEVVLGEDEAPVDVAELGSPNIDEEAVDEEDDAVAAGRGQPAAAGEASALPLAAGDGLADSVAVPDFTGMSLGAAIRAARRSGIEIECEGTGVGAAQSPALRHVPRGTIVRVSFRPGS